MDSETGRENRRVFIGSCRQMVAGGVEMVRWWLKGAEGDELMRRLD